MHIFVYLSTSLYYSIRSLRAKTTLFLWYLYSQCLTWHIKNASQIFFWGKWQITPTCFQTNSCHFSPHSTCWTYLLSSNTCSFKWSVYSFFLTEIPFPRYLRKTPLLGSTPNITSSGKPSWLTHTIMASSNNLAVHFPATLTKIQTLQRQWLVVVPLAIFP